MWGGGGGSSSWLATHALQNYNRIVSRGVFGTATKKFIATEIRGRHAADRSSEKSMFLEGGKKRR